MAKNKKGPTIYVPVKYRELVEECALASAGPRANITGMRKHYWGDAPLIRCGVYVYRVQYEDFYRFQNLI